MGGRKRSAVAADLVPDVERREALETTLARIASTGADVDRIVEVLSAAKKSSKPGHL